MNIGIFTDTYVPQLNGVATSTHILTRELAKRGHTVYVFTTSDPGAGRMENVFRMPSVKAPFSPNNRIAMLYSPRALAKIGRLKLDVVHTQTEFSLGILGKIAAEFTRAPMVHTYHTMYVDYVHYIAGGRIFTPQAAQRYSRIFCNRARAVITPVEKSKASLLSYGVARPIHVIPTGMDFAPFARISNEEMAWVKGELGLPMGCPVVVSVGRVAREKSLDIVLRQWPKVLERVPNAKFVVVGGGPFLEELRQMAAALGVEQSVIFAGSRPWAEIGKYYQAGDAFVSASTSETQGLTYIEAMAARVCVCAIRDESVAGLVEDGVTGFSFDGERDVADTLVKALNDRDACRRLAEAAFKRIQPMSAARFGERVEALYDELITTYPKR